MLMSSTIQSSAESPCKTQTAGIHDKMSEFVTNLQNDIVSALEVFEGPGSFLRDEWTREEGGHGRSCVLQKGKVFEKAGVNVSIIKSPAPPSMIQQMRAHRIPSLSIDTKYDMSVAGISLVIHPHNPHAPTVHLNYRYFELLDKNQVVAWWFGGGSDLTPSYIYEEDCVHFHQVLKDACDNHDSTYYPKFKKWCDEYFFNTHRGESRGIGGIFFDDLDTKSPIELFNFVSECGNSFIRQYMPLVEKRKNMEFTNDQKEWQQLRRGRYVEFNLVHDRGTKFGLATPGVRIESVLMSLPLTARWEYQHIPIEGSPEDNLLKVLKNPRDWL